MALSDASIRSPARGGADKLGVLVALLVAAAWILLPFVLFRANRIVPGAAVGPLDALPPLELLLLAGLVAVALPVSFFRTPVPWRLALGLAGLLLLSVLVGRAATHLLPPGDSFARVSPGAGFWLLAFAFALLVADALTRLRPPPALRIGLLVLVFASLAALLASGAWNDLSILREYANRADSFWRELRNHALLAFGSLAAAALVGIPLGILCHRVRLLRVVVLNLLNMVQTIPSIALFGLLIAPLAWVAAAVPGAAALGISGIGATPALVALFAYSLLPVVANTVVGLEGVPPAADDAARGMGMTDLQRLRAVQLPLAFPVILTGIRIVLVQNIGLATIAALIGGGGLGVFVFQGIGQQAVDLVLLGAVPTVALSFAAAVVLDALVELASAGGRR